MSRITDFIIRHFKPIAILSLIWLAALVVHNLLAWSLPLKTHLRNYAIVILISAVLIYVRARYGAPTDFRVGGGRNTRGISAPFPVFFAGVLALAIYTSASAFAMVSPVEPYAVVTIVFAIVMIPE